MNETIETSQQDITRKLRTIVRSEWSAFFKNRKVACADFDHIHYYRNPTCIDHLHYFAILAALDHEGMQQTALKVMLVEAFTPVSNKKKLANGHWVFLDIGNPQGRRWAASLLYMWHLDFAGKREMHIYKDSFVARLRGKLPAEVLDRASNLLKTIPM